MDSPLLEHRACPTCPGLIAGADLYRLCFQCLGPDHAEDGLSQSPACNACRMIPLLSRRHRGHNFRVKFGPPEEAEDEDLEVVEMGEQDDEVPFVFAIPRGQVATFTGEEDDEDASLSGTSGSGGQEGPAHRSGGGACGPTAPPTAAFDRGFTARSIRRSRPSSRPLCQISGSVWICI
ncbi:hypothetical protein OYC64_021176 [Pagothenia borchgrevinki]|uniref:Uncharacterized protein n=1 Tax=Pagothenia borchgrevinki TaxID=8213 RepID=A0ABD2FZN7_PAGBO